MNSKIVLLLVIMPYTSPETLASDKQATAAKLTEARLNVRVKVVIGEEKSKKNADKIETWIRQGLTKSGHSFVRADSKWMMLNSDDTRLHTGPGLYIDGSVRKEHGSFLVEVNGCAGERLSAEAKLKMKAGDRTVVNVMGGKQGTGIFIAIEVIESN